jgi:hypothetical protein
MLVIQTLKLRCIYAVSDLDLNPIVFYSVKCFKNAMGFWVFLQQLLLGIKRRCHHLEASCDRGLFNKVLDSGKRVTKISFAQK